MQTTFVNNVLKTETDGASLLNVIPYEIIERIHMVMLLAHGHIYSNQMKTMYRMCAWTTLASHLSKDLKGILQILLKEE